MVSILFKRDASDIDGVNICYLSKLLLHAQWHAYVTSGHDRSNITLYSTSLTCFWQIFVKKKSWVLLLLNWGRGEVGIGLYLVLSTVCQRPSFQTCIEAHLLFFIFTFFTFFRLRGVTSAASLRIARLPFHFFIFCDIFPNFHLPLYFTHLHEKHPSSLIMSIKFLYFHY